MTVNTRDKFDEAPMALLDRLITTVEEGRRRSEERKRPALRRGVP